MLYDQVIAKLLLSYKTRKKCGRINTHIANGIRTCDPSVWAEVSLEQCKGTSF